MEKTEKTIENTSLSGLKIGKHRLVLPIVQGGMGIGVSTAELAGAVAREGGIGTLSAGAIHKTALYRKYRADLLKQAVKNSLNGKLSAEDHRLISVEANILCIKKEIAKAKEISQGNGKIFVNIMVASKDYDACVKAACEGGADGIVSGAGLPKDLHKLTTEYPDVALIPILSQAKGVRVLLDIWNKPYEVQSKIANNGITTINGQKIENKEGELYQEDGTKIAATINDASSTITIGDREYTYSIDRENKNIILTKKYEGRSPDAITLEDPSKAGGHLGAIKGKLDEVNNTETTLEVAVPATVQLLKDRNLDIPVIAAGGIVTRKDIDRIRRLGATGVQLGSLFLTTEESNAHPDFKNDVINAKLEDVGTYNSSAFYPARYLKKSLENDDVEGITIKTKDCLVTCLTHCALKDSIGGYAQICIHNKLLASIKGSDGKGLKFIGYPFSPEGENKIASLIQEIHESTGTLNIIFPTVKEIMEILQKSVEE
ncbi:MAG: nitronate monooxygenase [Candidatus Absconditabacterales bacterium]